LFDARLLQGIVVHDDRDLVRELGGAVDLALVSDLVERGLAVVARRDLLPGEAAAERDEHAPGGVGADAVAAHVDEIRDVAGSEPGEERLVVEARHRVADAVAAGPNCGVGEVQAALSNVVTATEPVHVERTTGVYAGACGACRENDAQRCPRKEQREPLPTIPHSCPPG
jgi:hypothetical protein